MRVAGLAARVGRVELGLIGAFFTSARVRAARSVAFTVRFVVFFFWLAQEVEQEVDAEAGDLGLPFVQDEGQDEWEQYTNWGSDDVPVA